MKLYICSGIPGSGKSTYIQGRFFCDDVDIISPDEIRGELTGDVSDQSRNDEVWGLAHKRLHSSLTDERCVVFDSVSADRRARKSLIKIGQKYDAEIISLVFPVTYETAVERQKGRTRQVPHDVIQKFSDKFTIPNKNEGFHGIILADPSINK